MRNELMNLLNPNIVNVFVSLPMRGHTDEEIRDRQNQIFDLVSNVREKPFNLTYTIWQEQPPYQEHRSSINNQLWYLGKSIQALGDSDIAIFACDWATARGCIVERAICSIYKIPIIDESDIIDINSAIDELRIVDVIGDLF